MIGKDLKLNKDNHRETNTKILGPWNRRLVPTQSGTIGWGLEGLWFIYLCMCIYILYMIVWP